MNPRERLSAVLQHRAVDRPPVICPGGMMNAAVVEAMEWSAYSLPAAHCSEEQMAGLAIEVYERTGFENIGLPFCMTVEAEMMGSRVNLGTLSCEPKIEKEAYPSVDDVPLSDIQDLLASGRAAVVLGAIGRASKMHPSVPVTGVVTGPLSVGASIVDPVTFFKELRKNREKAHRVMGHVSNLIMAFAKRMLEAGASAITVADPSASGEILGPALFEEYAVRYLNEIVDALHAAHGHVIVHICGDLKSVRHHLGSIRADALSMDSVMSLTRIKAKLPGIATMGNVSTQLLSTGSAYRIGSTAERLVREGTGIIAPACGLDTRTPLKSIRALTDRVRAYAP
jgi:MtaA/CmuA family methyltransferase